MKNYIRQDGCWNCRNIFIKIEYEETPAKLKKLWNKRIAIRQAERQGIKEYEDTEMVK